MADNPCTAVPAPRPPWAPADPRRELEAIAACLRGLSARLDAADRQEVLGDGAAVVALDHASHAVHLAILEVEHCLTAA